MEIWYGVKLDKGTTSYTTKGVLETTDLKHTVDVSQDLGVYSIKRHTIIVVRKNI